jgi:exopolysaccharide production protein ExoZ
MLNRINLVRTISCVLIAVFHVTVFLNANSGGLHLSMAGIPGPGFHLFLLISGFVLLHTTRPDETPLAFLGKRLARLVPLYWVMTFAVIALVLWRPWTFGQADLSLESIAKSLFFLPHADLNGRLHPILYVGWALNYTVFFYLIFAISLMFALRARHFVVLGLIVLITPAALLLPDEDMRRFYASPILLEFAAGIAVGALLLTKRAEAWIKNHRLVPMLVVGLAGMFATAYADNTGHDLPALAEALAYSASGALVLFAIGGMDLYRPQLNSKLIARAGSLSYAVLLVHPLLIAIIAAPIAIRIEDDLQRAIVVIPVLLLSSIVCAYLAHVCIEKPANSWLRARFAKRAPRPETNASPGRPAAADVEA